MIHDTIVLLQDLVSLSHIGCEKSWGVCVKFIQISDIIFWYKSQRRIVRTSFWFPWLLHEIYSSRNLNCLKGNHWSCPCFPYSSQKWAFRVFLSRAYAWVSFGAWVKDASPVWGDRRKKNYGQETMNTHTGRSISPNCIWKKNISDFMMH